jgi:sensor histidine kinase regulating citrate/malate metabolism
MSRTISVSQKIIGLLAFMLGMFVLITAGLYFGKLKPDAHHETDAHFVTYFQENIAKEINAKLDGSALIAISVAENKTVIDAFKSNNENLLRTEIAKTKKSIQENSRYTGVLFQLISHDLKTVFRTWNDVKGDDLKEIGIVKKAAQSQKVQTAQEVGKSGYFIRTIAPVKDDTNTVVGYVSVHLGLGSIHQAFKNQNITYGLLLDRAIVGKEFKPSDIIINERYVTAHKTWFDEAFNTFAKSLDYETLSKEKKILTPHHFASAITAKDSNDRVIGIHLIGVDRTT